MKNNYSEIAFVLDRSGSMESCRGAAIEGFNRFLADQQKVEGLAKLTLVLFDDEYLLPVNALPVAEVLPLDEQTFVPRRTTALLDAIGRTVDELGVRLAALPEADRPAEVIVAILTDGAENASHEYTWNDLARVIKQQTEQYRWTFLFLGANQDAIATAAQMNIAAANAACYVADAAGVQATSRTIGRRVSGIRLSRSVHATPADVRDATADLSQILREESAQETE